MVVRPVRNKIMKTYKSGICRVIRIAQHLRMELGEIAEPEDLGKAKSHCKTIVRHTTRNVLGQGAFRSQGIKERGTCNERSAFDLLRTLESRDDCRSHATISEMRINDLVVHVKGEEERGIDDGDIILSSTGLI